jgi:hypothetical protein
MTIEQRAAQIVADEIANGVITREQAKSSLASHIRWLRERGESRVRREYGLSLDDANR